MKYLNWEYLWQQYVLINHLSINVVIFWHLDGYRKFGAIYKSQRILFHNARSFRCGIGCEEANSIHVNQLISITLPSLWAPWLTWHLAENSIYFHGPCDVINFVCAIAMITTCTRLTNKTQIRYNYDHKMHPQTTVNWNATMNRNQTNDGNAIDEVLDFHNFLLANFLCRYMYRPCDQITMRR